MHENEERKKKNAQKIRKNRLHRKTERNLSLSVHCSTPTTPTSTRWKLVREVYAGAISAVNLALKGTNSSTLKSSTLVQALRF